MTAGDTFLEVVVPVLGGIVGVIMFASPLKAVLRARREKTLGDLNPMPFPAIMANCAGWIGYGWVIDNIYVYVPNEIGFLLGAFYTLSCYALVDSKSRDRQMAIFLFFSTIITVVGAISTLGGLAYDPRRLLWGFTCNAILLVYYSAPLSTVYHVLRTRNAASLYWPLCLMNLVNGSLWTAYGIAVTDYFIWVPNGIGAVLAAFTLVLIWILPNKPYKTRESPASSVSEAPSSNSRRPLVATNGATINGVAAAEGGQTLDEEAPLGGASLPLPPQQQEQQQQAQHRDWQQLRGTESSEDRLAGVA